MNRKWPSSGLSASSPGPAKLFQHCLQLLKTRARFRKPTGGGQLLILGKRLIGALDERFGGTGSRRRAGRGGRLRLARRLPRYLSQRTRPAFNQKFQRFLEGRRVGKPVLRRQNDEPQRRHRASLSLKIDRFDEEQCVFNRNDKEVAANHGRALLIPQRQLRRQLRVLIDLRLNLKRTVDKPCSRKVIGT